MVRITQQMHTTIWDGKVRRKSRPILSSLLFDPYFKNSELYLLLKMLAPIAKFNQTIIVYKY